MAETSQKQKEMSAAYRHDFNESAKKNALDGTHLDANQSQFAGRPQQFEDDSKYTAQPGVDPFDYSQIFSSPNGHEFARKLAQVQELAARMGNELNLSTTSSSNQATNTRTRRAEERSRDTFRTLQNVITEKGRALYQNTLRHVDEFEIERNDEFMRAMAENQAQYNAEEQRHQGLTAQLDTLHTRKDGLETQRDQLDNDIQENQKKQQENKAEEDTLNEEKDLITQQKEENEAMRLQTAEELAVVVEYCENNAETAPPEVISECGVQIAGLENEQMQLRVDHVKLQSEIDQIMAALEDTKREQERLKAEEVELQFKKEQNDAELNGVNAEIETTKVELAQSEENMAKIKAEAEQMQRDYDAETKELGAYKEWLNSPDVQAKIESGEISAQDVINRAPQAMKARLEADNDNAMNAAKSQDLSGDDPNAPANATAQSSFFSYSPVPQVRLVDGPAPMMCGMPVMENKNEILLNNRTATSAAETLINTKTDLKGQFGAAASPAMSPVESKIDLAGPGAPQNSNQNNNPDMNVSSLDERHVSISSGPQMGMAMM